MTQARYQGRIVSVAWHGTTKCGDHRAKLLVDGREEWADAMDEGTYQEYLALGGDCHSFRGYGHARPLAVILG